MMKTKICIVDDERMQLERIHNYIENYDVFPEREVLTFDDSRDKDILEKEFDLYFLDIDMPYINGFELAEKIQRSFSEAIFIFVSSHNNFVFDSFRFNAFYFVRKDTFEADMEVALGIVQKQFVKNHKKYPLNNNGETITLLFKDILYFEKVINNLSVTTLSHGELHERKSMKKLLSELNAENFCLVNSGVCINFDNVLEIRRGSVLMVGGRELSVSRRKLNEVKDRYLKYLMNRGN